MKKHLLKYGEHSNRNKDSPNKALHTYKMGAHTLPILRVRANVRPERMMKNNTKESGFRLPPQLIGVHEDALRIHATQFKIERMPTVIMASFSTSTQAEEIDFKNDAGQEMIDYIVEQSGLKGGKGKFVLEYEGKTFNCIVTGEPDNNPEWVCLSWS